MLLDIPLTNPVLRNEFADYARPNDKISYMMKKGEIISLTKGHYLMMNAVQNNKYINYQIANVVYGPSYISRYSALTFYGLLAETTSRVESITNKRSKIIENELGIFEYSKTINTTVFSLGIKSIKLNEVVSILIASPEKAICDIIWTTSNLVLKNVDDLVYFLEEDIRMDIEELKNANQNIIKSCIEFGKKKKEIQLLLELIIKLGKNDITGMV